MKYKQGQRFKYLGQGDANYIFIAEVCETVTTSRAITASKTKCFDVGYKCGDFFRSGFRYLIGQDKE